MRRLTRNLTPPSKMAIKEKKYYVWVRTSLVSNIALMTIGDINISRDAIGCSKVSKGNLKCKKM